MSSTFPQKKKGMGWVGCKKFFFSIGKGDDLGRVWGFFPPKIWNFGMKSCWFSRDFPGFSALGIEPQFCHSSLSRLQDSLGKLQGFFPCRFFQGKSGGGGNKKKKREWSLSRELSELQEKNGGNREKKSRKMLLGFWDFWSLWGPSHLGHSMIFWCNSSRFWGISWVPRSV